MDTQYLYSTWRCTSLADGTRRATNVVYEEIFLLDWRISEKNFPLLTLMQKKSR